MKDAGLSQRALAKLIGVDHSAVSLMMRGRRKIQLEEAGALSSILHAPVGEILKHAGIPVPPDARTVPLVGYIDGQGEAHVDWQHGSESVLTPPDLPGNTVAVQFRTARSAWESMDGWTLYIQPPSRGEIRGVGQLALACTRPGMTMVGFLRRGYRSGTYNLMNFGAGSIDSVELAWAMPVLLLRP